MPLLFLSITLFTYFIVRFNPLIYKNKLMKQLILTLSCLITIPTIYDYYSYNIYFSTDGIADVLILLTGYLIPLSIIAN